MPSSPPSDIIRGRFDRRGKRQVGRPIEILVPERFRGAHVGHRESYHTPPRTRPMGAGFDLTGRRKDGSAFSVEISLSPIETRKAPA